MIIPTLETDRLILRAPDPTDFEAFARFRVSERSIGVGGPYTRVQAFDQMCELFGHWFMRGYGRWMVAEKSSNEPLGVVGLFYPEDWPEPEIAWTVFENGEGKGIAFEAAMASRQYAYETLGWDTAISCVVPDNVRSITLAKRMGAIQEGSFHHEDIGDLQVWRHVGREAVQ
ncbi:MAG: RimJ/RimL family protein N-acetyltransferase [Paracoccaceae bacterium]|jgi:RimJ/RimL family protein N-acetyltransferase